MKFPKNQPKVEENSAVGTVIGTVVSYDSEPMEQLSFQLVDNADGTFSLDRDVACVNATNKTDMIGARSKCFVKLILSKAVNFETQPSYTIIMRTTDNDGLFHAQSFDVGVVDKNDRPTAITIGGLNYGIVLENQSGTLVDEMATADEDNGQNHVYSIVGNNSHMFAVYKSYLFLSRETVFDYENTASYMIMVNTTDSGNPPMSFTQTLELRVQDVNEAPLSISLSGNSVYENSPVGTLIGNLTVEDPDNVGKRGKWQTHSCIISAGSSGLFTIQDMALIVAHNGLDYEQVDLLFISSS